MTAASSHPEGHAFLLDGLSGKESNIDYSQSSYRDDCFFTVPSIAIADGTPAGIFSSSTPGGPFCSMWIPLSLKMCRLTGNIIEHRLLCLYKPSRTNFQKFRQTRILQRAMDDSLTTIRFITLKGHRTISFCGCCEMVGRQSIPRSLWRIQ